MWGELFNKNLLLSFVEAVSNFDMAKLVESEATVRTGGAAAAPKDIDEASTWSFFSISGFLFFWVATVATKFMVGSEIVPTSGGKDTVPSTDSAALATDPNATIKVTSEIADGFFVRYPQFSFTDQSKLISLYFWLFVIFAACFILLRYFFPTKIIVKFIESGAIIVLIAMTLIILSLTVSTFIQPPAKFAEDFKIFLTPSTFQKSMIICFLVICLLLIASLVKNRDRLNDNRLNFYIVMKWVASVIVVLFISSAIMHVSLGFNPPYIPTGPVVAATPPTG